MRRRNALNLRHLDGDGESQVPARTLLMQLSCALLDGCTESGEQLCLPVSRPEGYTDTTDVILSGQ
jgi:hypothetical protein